MRDGTRRALVSIRAACERMFVFDIPTVLHADLDSFYASVEQRDDPKLLGRPVIVGGGVVLAASYEAKARGVRTAMGGSRARALCPDAVVVPPRMSAYSEASKAVFAIFERTSPLVEALSIDEAFLDVRGLEHILGTPTEIAVRLRRGSDRRSASRSRSGSPARSSWPRWPAGSRSRTDCW
jgi:DNA polymerase-4